MSLDCCLGCLFHPQIQKQKNTPRSLTGEANVKPLMPDRPVPYFYTSQYLCSTPSHFGFQFLRLRDVIRLVVSLLVISLGVTSYMIASSILSNTQLGLPKHIRTSCVFCLLLVGHISTMKPMFATHL